MKTTKNIIQINQLFKKYKGADYFSINNLNLAIEEKAIYGLIGPNGAGKTTLLSMLCGLIRPTSGNFIINGLNYENNSLEIKETIGVVPQEYALYPTLTARENLMYFGSMYGLKGKNLKEKVNSALDQLGLLKFADKKIDTFSGGMKRRINLIAGILHEPLILFLDEPTVGVDVQSKNVIISYLRELNAKGTTIIYTSHHLMEAQDFCTKISIIDRGTVYVSGTPSELILQTSGANNLEDVFILLTGKELRDDV